MDGFDREVQETATWLRGPRFAHTTRLYTARQVVAQRGSLGDDHAIARDASVAFYARLRALFAARQCITTFGPYSPGQAVVMRRLGIEAIYLGGWATSAKGSADEDPGPDLASYPLSQVPLEATAIVRALRTADRNQQYARSRVDAAQRAAMPLVDYRPFIIADADTGHGGDPHVRNLIRRFVEAGVPGYHIEDQRPGTKKCGHQGGKVLVSCAEQIKRLNAARFQLDVMEVPGILVGRTDAEAATLLDCASDERDQPFVLGSTNTHIPPYRHCYLALLKSLHDAGLAGFNGFELYALGDDDMRAGQAWLAEIGLGTAIQATISAHDDIALDSAFDTLAAQMATAWELAAGLQTYGESVAKIIEQYAREGDPCGIEADDWRAFASVSSWRACRRRAEQLGIDLTWDAEHAMTPEGYYQVCGGLPYAIARSLAVAPFCDILWMETKTAVLTDAKHFAAAIHARHPDHMLAYNLSPSFNWDTTGMQDDDMRAFPQQLGQLGYVFNFITYGGHQIDGVAAEEFATALCQDGMLALARLQRKIRLLESPYKTPQTLVGGPRLDAALVASSGRTATTKAMGKDSTQHQHLVQTEIPTSLLASWLAMWCEHYHMKPNLLVTLRPHRAGSELLELGIFRQDSKVASVIFAPIHDRRKRSILSVHDQNTFEPSLRQKRLMSLIHLFLIHRYDAASVHYVSPTEDNRYQTAKMRNHGLFAEVHDEVGDVIIAPVNRERLALLLAPDRDALRRLIMKQP